MSECRAGAWMKVEGDDLVHAGPYPMMVPRTLCGLTATTVIVVSIPQPKMVTCEACLAAGALNVPEPEGGYQSSTHTAYIPVREGFVA